MDTKWWTGPTVALATLAIAILSMIAAWLAIPSENWCRWSGLQCPITEGRAGPAGAPSPPATPIEYVTLRKLSNGVVVDRTRYGHDYRVTTFGLAVITAKQPISKNELLIDAVDFNGSMCGTDSSSPSFDENVLVAYSSNEFDGYRDFVREYLNKWGDVVVFGHDYNVPARQLTDIGIDLIVYIRVDFENQSGLRVSRFFSAMPWSFNIGAVTQSEYEQRYSLIQKIAAVEKQGGMVGQPYSCLSTSHDFP